MIRANARSGCMKAEFPITVLDHVTEELPGICQPALLREQFEQAIVGPAEVGNVYGIALQNPILVGPDCGGNVSAALMAET